ncbi:MAG: ScyD/ScyE family protein [Acidimicrobiia bacterium]|nr:ScyD/ScyE family protein [Acidimicrobiia bacterium]
MQAVPTSVAVGPDGYAYVGELTGFPFPTGEANVYKIDPATGDMSVFASGFTNIIDLEFGPDGSLYVVQISSSGLLSDRLDGAVIKVSPDGSRAVFFDALFAPTGIAVDQASGDVYVSNCGICPGFGEVIRLAGVPATPITLGYSASNDRANPSSLKGATVSGKIYPFVEPLDPGLGFTTVDFYLDGVHARTEYLAPYDFAGGLLTRATAWHSSSVADGEHTIKAVGTLPDGSTIEATATFTVDNAPVAADFALAVSDNAHRTDPVMLEGATVFGDVYPFVYPLFPEGFASFGTVSFYLDGVHFHTEYAAPYDFVSGATDKAKESWDTTTVADGEHTITVKANRAGMKPLVTEAAFTVANHAPDIVDVAIADGRFTTLVAAVQAAGLEDALRGLGPFTVFAPTDDAFAALPAGTVEALLADPDALADILRYHVVGGRVDAAAVVGLTGATTLQGSAITIEVVDGAVILNGTVEVIITDVAARNGIIHVIDGVLLPPVEPVRFATFNASLNRFNAGDLVSDLSTPDNTQAQAIAEIIQRTRPEVLLLNEFDYDDAGEAARLFQQNYLSISQNGAEPIEYDYAFSAPSNTGIPSGFDLNNDGEIGGPDDAFGFGFFAGQYGMQVYSQHPIDFANVRTFQNFLWADMPGARLPVDPETGAWFSAEELAVVRLSSKSHWDVPIDIDGHTVNFLVSHPTPPVFDGPEDRNGTRNADEIRFWSDYVNGADYIYDDAGVSGGWSGEYFVVAGDQNSDPLDGDSIPGSAQQLLDDPRVNATTTPASAGAVEQDGLQGGINESHLSDPAFDTADFNDDPAPGNLRADYVLPSANLDIADSGVFWPESTDPLFSLVGTFPFPSSDHRLVWVDLVPGSTPLPPASPPPVVLTGEIDGAPYRIVRPGSAELWNGVLLAYAHGYQDALDHPSEGTDRGRVDAAPGGAATEAALVELGFALAGSEYKTDGWAVADGIVDTEALIDYFGENLAEPEATILWGFSMGSVIAGHAAENSDAVDGVIAACFVGAGAPRAFDGGMALLLAYEAAFGFPESWGTPGDVRDDLDFDTEVLPVVGSQLFADPLDPSAGLKPENIGLFTFVQMASGIPAEDFFTEWLFTDMYFATEARAELERRAGGAAVGNVGHVYSLSAKDRAVLATLGLDDAAVDGLLAGMNATTYTPDPAARAYLETNYQYTGALTKPVLTLHTTIDGLVLVEHESAYAETVNAAGASDWLMQAYTDTYPPGASSGHCTFEPEQLGASVEAMLGWLLTGTAPGAEAFPEAFGFVPGFQPGPWPQPPPVAGDSIPLPLGFQPEGVAIGNGQVFAGSLATGAIYQADLATGLGAPLVIPTDGRTAVGMTVDARTNYLYVAGGPFGNAFVYDAATGAELAAIRLNSAAPFETLVNDVIVTDTAAYFTDSFRPVFYRVALGAGGTLPDPIVVEEIGLNSGFPFIPGGINSNGIVAAGDNLIINHTDEGKAFTVDPATGSAMEIDLGGAVLTAGDGLVLDGTTLYVVQNTLNQIAVIELSADFASGTLVGTITSPLFRVPTTADHSNGDLYAVNARFDVAPPPFPGAPPADPGLDYDIVRVSKSAVTPLPGQNIVASVVKAPIVPDGDVAGATTDFVINLDRSLDPNVDGRSLAAGDTIRITLPDAFINNGFDTGAPGAPNCVPGPCNLGVLLQGWPQHPIAPPAAKYSLAMEGSHTFVFTALEDLGPAGSANPGIKQIHLISLGFTNPAPGDYPIVIEAQTGPGGAVETGTGSLTIRPAIVPTIDVTSVFNDGTPNTIYQKTEVGTATPLDYDFLLWEPSGGPKTGVTLDGSVLMRNGFRVGEVTITAPAGATGQSVTVGAPSTEITAPVLGVPAARLTAQFTAGSVPGIYSVAFSLDGGTTVTMYVTATSVADG